MILIDAAIQSLDQRMLESLVDKHDRARTREENELIAEQLEAHVGPTIRAMLGKSLAGIGIGGDDLAALVSEAVRKGLQESGITRLKRQDISAERLRSRMQAAGDEAGRRLRAALPQDIVDELFATKYLKASAEQRLVEALNDLLRKPGLPSTLGMQRQEVSTSAIELSASNAAALHTLFPEAVAAVEPPKRDLLGYIAKFVVPAIKKRELTNAGKISSTDMTKARKSLGPIIDELRGRLGRFPDAEEVKAVYEKRLDRYEPAVRWFQEQLERVRPDGGFRINSLPALKDAKEILINNGYAPATFEKESLAVPKEYFKPFGLGTIKKLLESMSQGTPEIKTPTPSIFSAPSSTQQIPDWSSLAIPGNKERLQAAIVNRLFGGAAYEAERMVGRFVATFPSPNPGQVERFLNSLSPEVQDDIQSAGGFDAVASHVDERIRDLLRSPDAVDQIAAELGMSSGTGQRSAEAIRRLVFGRSVRRTARIVRGTATQTNPRPPTVESEEEAKGDSADYLFLVRQMPGFYAEVQLAPGATLDDALAWALKFAEKGSSCWIPVTRGSDRGIYVHLDGSIELGDCPKGGIRVRRPKSLSQLMPIRE